MTKTAKNLHNRVCTACTVECRGYKEDPKNIAFHGNPNENPVEFLRRFKCYTSRINPMMGNNDKLGILHCIHKVHPRILINGGES